MSEHKGETGDVRKEIGQYLADLCGHDLDQTVSVDSLKNKLASWYQRMEIGSDISSHPENSDESLFQLRESMRELQCLYRVLEILHESNREEDIRIILNKVLPILSDSFMRPDVTEVAIKFDGWDCSTPGYDPKYKKISSHFTFSDGKKLTLNVCRTDHPFSVNTRRDHQHPGVHRIHYSEPAELESNPNSHDSADFTKSESETSGTNGDIASRYVFLKEEQLLLDKIAVLLSQYYEHHLSAVAFAESESFVWAALYSIGDAVITTDTEGRVVRMNPVAGQLTGWKESEARGKPVNTVFRIIKEDTREEAQNPVEKILQNGEIVQLAHHTLLLSKDWKEIPIVSFGAPIVNKDSDAAGVVLVFRSQAEERESRVRLEESEQKFRSIVEGAPNPIYLHVDHRIVYVNLPAVQLFGAGSADELIGKSVQGHIHPDFNAINQKHIVQLYDKQVSVSEILEQPYIRLDGSEVWVETIGAPITYKDKNGALVFVRDITERREDQQTILEKIKEKEVLLAEIHHRVKNNMAVITGLLELEAHQNTDPSLIEVLLKANTRIRSMALIHEKLYKAESLSKIEFGSYMMELAGYIKEHFQDQDREVKLKFDVDTVQLDINRAVPCGIILNEVITNGLKYAFRNVKEGEILLSLKSENGNYVIVYRDNGSGFDDTVLKSIPAGSFSSLGMQLVSGLTQQLKGQLELKNDGGAVVEIRFPKTSTSKKN